MNKEEKIGMYTRNEIFEHLCENSDIGMLGRSMYDAVMSKIDNLQSQLATYKDKEDKLKECPNCHIDFETAYQRVNTNDGNTYFKVSIEYCSKCMYINDCDADL